ncbi:MAG: hypothetical protein KDD89_09125 [Anaerolineales bacterium]|nr:hypothetical protein [Anaerolineales bacterium]
MATEADSATTNANKGSDKFLWGIVITVILLVFATLFMLWQQPNPVAYREGDETEPADVAYNYLTAIQLRDAERGFAYLSPDLVSPPDGSAQFWLDLSRTYCPLLNENRSVTYEIDDVMVIDNTAVVEIVYTTYTNRNTFFAPPDTYTQTDTVTLQQNNQRWYITHADQCWNDCWDNDDPNAPCR